MKMLPIIATVLLAFAIGAFAQTGRSRPQTNQPPPAEQAPDRQMQTDAQMEAEDAAMQEMMKQEMQEMQTHMRDMQMRVDKLRRDAQRVQDPATRTALLDAVGIWEQMIGHMQKNMDRMRGPAGPSGGPGYDEPRRQAPQGGYEEPRRQPPPRYDR